jgi:hypothetical protein
LAKKSDQNQGIIRESNSLVWGAAMSVVSFAVAAALAVAGIGISIYGIAGEHFKPTAIGLVLIFGSGVFATLCLASRSRTVN